MPRVVLYTLAARLSECLHRAHQKQPVSSIVELDPVTKLTRAAILIEVIGPRCRVTRLCVRPITTITSSWTLIERNGDVQLIVNKKARGTAW